MDPDVALFLLMVLDNTSVTVPVADLAATAEKVARAREQLAKLADPA